MARKLKSGIVGQAQVVFGGAIRMELGWVKSARGEELAIGMAELKHPAAKAGDPVIDEDTYNGTQVTLVFPGFESLNVFRHALDLLEAELKKRIAERDAQQKIDFDDADPSHLVHEHIDPPTFEEAQGGQKVADKVEPKFEIGDLITNGVLVGKIDEIHELGYHAYFGDHYADVPDIENWHKWTIADAKDGDVLCCESGWTCIFKALDNRTNTFSSYCFMDKDKWFCNSGSEGHTLDERFVKAYNGEISPATKEQRALFFQKMHEAGYEWDADKKELKKIEQKTAWSEEDEKIYSRICDLIHSAAYKNYDVDEDGNECGEYANIKGWFKKLKGRVQPQPKQEWSEEDKRNIDRIYSILRQAADTHAFSTSCRLIGDKECIELQDFLKFLKDRFGCETNCTTMWKPSGEQMEILQYLCKTSSHPNEKVIPTLKSLYQDLKKLREE